LSVTVIFTDGRLLETDPFDMAERAAEVFPVGERVPGAPGEGFDLLAWHAAVAGDPETARATHLIARAADEFEATIPFDQLGGALLQYATDGRPLVRGGPIRLYVPDGTSACLNVKSVVRLRFVRDGSLGPEASYGFRNEVSPERLAKGLKFR